MRLLNDELLPALEREGIRLMRVSELDDETQAALERTFDDNGLSRADAARGR